MKCPACDTTLSIASREGIEIDFCPNCRGVWLDRGELDKIIERSATMMTAPPAGRYEDYVPTRDEWSERRRDEGGYDRDRDRGRYRDEGHDRDRHRGQHPKRKKRSFLENLFEFGGEGGDD